MTDLLIRDIPEQVLAAIDAKAKRLGISRIEYVRRRLAQAATGSGEGITTQDLRRFVDTFADLADAEVMGRAWRQTAG